MPVQKKSAAKNLHQKLVELRSGAEINALGLFLKEEVVESLTKQLPNHHFQVSVKMLFTWVNAETPSETESAQWQGMHTNTNPDNCLVKAMQQARDTFLGTIQKPGGAPPKEMHTNKAKSLFTNEIHFSFINEICDGAATQEDWDKAWDYIQTTPDYKKLNEEEAVRATEHYQTLYLNWSPI